MRTLRQYRSKKRLHMFELVGCSVQRKVGIGAFFVLYMLVYSCKAHEGPLLRPQILRNRWMSEATAYVLTVNTTTCCHK